MRQSVGAAAIAAIAEQAEEGKQLAIRKCKVASLFPIRPHSIPSSIKLDGAILDPTASCDRELRLEMTEFDLERRFERVDSLG